MSDDQPADIPTVLDRLVVAGLSEERIGQHLTAGRVQMDGERVTDLQQAAPPSARLVIVGD